MSESVRVASNGDGVARLKLTPTILSALRGLGATINFAAKFEPSPKMLDELRIGGDISMDTAAFGFDGRAHIELSAVLPDGTKVTEPVEPIARGEGDSGLLGAGGPDPDFRRRDGDTKARGSGETHVSEALADALLHRTGSRGFVSGIEAAIEAMEIGGMLGLPPSAIAKTLRRAQRHIKDAVD